MLPDLRPYQLEVGERVLRQPYIGLSLAMSMGKTRIALWAARWALDVGRWLVVAPKRVRDHVWGAEASKWGLAKPAELRVLTHDDLDLRRATQGDVDHGAVPKDVTAGQLWFRDRRATRAHLLAAAAAHRICITSWDAVNWLALALGQRRPWDGLVFDELSLAKNRASNRWSGARQLSAGARRRIGLAGMFASEGSFDDIWPQQYLLDRGETLEPTLGGFRERFMKDATPYSVARTWVPRDDAAERELKDAIAKVWVSMSSAGHLQLPEEVVVDLEVDLSPELSRAASDLMDNALTLVQPGLSVLPASVAAGLNKALQVCAGALYVTDGFGRYVQRLHSAKVEALLEVVEQARGGVFCLIGFDHDRPPIMKALGARAKLIEEPGAMEAWLAGRVKVLVAHPASAAHGLNLQAGGSTVVWFNLTWSYDLYAQANARLRRPGQVSDRCFVYRIVTAHPMERMVLDALDRKQDFWEGVKSYVESKNKDACGAILVEG